MNIPDREKRIQLLEYTYVAFRILDDICDGDTPNNITLRCLAMRKGYVKEVNMILGKKSYSQ